MSLNERRYGEPFRQPASGWHFYGGVKSPFQHYNKDLTDLDLYRFFYNGNFASANLAVYDSKIEIDSFTGGSGYISTPTLNIDNGTTGGTGLTLACTILGGSVNTVTIVNQGTGYKTLPSIDTYSFCISLIAKTITKSPFVNKKSFAL